MSFCWSSQKPSHRNVVSNSDLNPESLKLKVSIFLQRQIDRRALQKKAKIEMHLFKSIKKILYLKMTLKNEFRRENSKIEYEPEMTLLEKFEVRFR